MSNKDEKERLRKTDAGKQKLSSFWEKCWEIESSETGILLKCERVTESLRKRKFGKIKSV